MDCFLRHLRRHLVGYLALLLAFTPGAYAASTALMPTNSVGSRQVINHSLKSVDFAAARLGQLKPEPTVRTALDSLPPGRTGDTVVRCRAGTHASGGGVALFTVEQNLQILVSAPALVDRKTGLFVLARDGSMPNAWEARVRNNGTAEVRYTTYAVCS